MTWSLMGDPMYCVKQQQSRGQISKALGKANSTASRGRSTGWDKQQTSKNFYRNPEIWQTARTLERDKQGHLLSASPWRAVRPHVGRKLQPQDTGKPPEL